MISARSFAPSAEFAPVTGTFTSGTTYRAGEVFYDFNVNGIWDGPDGLWEGVNCQETVFGLCGTSSSTGVGNHVCIVMSGSSAAFTVSSIPVTALTVTAGGGSATVDIADENGNVLPAGTVIQLNITNLVAGTATLSPANSGSNFVVPDTDCAGSSGGWPLPFTVVIAQSPSSTTTLSGSVELTVTPPAGKCLSSPSRSIKNLCAGGAI